MCQMTDHLGCTKRLWVSVSGWCNYCECRYRTGEDGPDPFVLVAGIIVQIILQVTGRERLVNRETVESLLEFSFTRVVDRHSSGRH